jgi:vancomycin resistance protein VanW
VVNLRLAVARMDGLVLAPGETFSYWRLIGKPSRRKGYREGMVLYLGRIGSDIGGGLCQLSNLIFWMTLHTPLTVVERYRHSHDVFPDADRTQPFGSGATCAYPHRDLMIRNDTDQPFQLCLQVGETCLEGQWRAARPGLPV